MTFKATSLLLSGLALALHPGAIAQIVPDRTLPVNSLVSPLPNGAMVNGGTVSGNNLFHSFERFSLPNGEVAIFNNAAAIQNIITRITGADRSIINGIIQAQGKANLLFLNPNGIVFGPDAKLLIGGAFLGTTANNVLFPGGQAFGRSTPNFNLIVSTPIGLDFSGSSGAIQVNNVGHNLTRDSLFTPIDRSQKPFGLQTAPGNSLALIGSGIRFDGGVATVNGGHLAIASVLSGAIPINIDAGRIDFEISPAVERGDITLTNRSALDGVFFGNSAISLYGANVAVEKGSLITTQNLGDISDRNVAIDAERLSLRGIDPLSRIQSGIFSESLGSGDAANIAISSRTVSLEEGGGIGTTAYSLGATGAISVSAVESISVAGVALLPDSARNSVIGSLNLGTGFSRPVSINSPKLTVSRLGSIISVTGLSAQGADLTLRGSSLLVETGGLIYATSLNSGRLGDVDIEAGSIELKGFAPNFDESNLGLVITSTDIENLSGVFTNSTGINSESSSITIAAGKLSITDGALIGSISLGNSDSSSIDIEAGEIFISGGSPSGSPSQIASRTLAAGNANAINIRAESIKLSDGGTINTSTTSSGNAGNITIKAMESITLDNALERANPTTISASASVLDPNLASLVGVTAISPTGHGGQIDIASPTLAVNRNSSIIARHEGLGLGGNIILNVDSLSSNEGKVLTTTRSGNGGDISINSRSAVLDGSTIATSSARTGDGGNISLNTNALGLFNSSRIEANAFEGDGGSISINADAFFNDGTGEITAFSALGAEGTVNINTEPYSFNPINVEPLNQPKPSEVALKACRDYGSRLTRAGAGQTPRGSNRSGRTFEDLIPLGQVVYMKKLGDGRVRFMNCREYLEGLSELELPQDGK